MLDRFPGLRQCASCAGLFGAFVLISSQELEAQESVEGKGSRVRDPKCEAVAVDRRRLEGATLGEALQGRVPGLNVVQTGGAGGGVGLSIRGSNSIRSGPPLILVDNVRINQLRGNSYRGLNSLPLLDFVNPADIDRIEVLRGPAATIQFGSDGSDGVIRIYTKRRGDGESQESGIDKVCDRTSSNGTLL